ncbi:hypothetical protein F8M41_018143 [Gigaspora margarita]|uniref:BZIP domain-containing protein n=1 Tax=Gigaspora margarita TaxID=4874 RepID=A0A8H4ELN7_GIGMA|nr:hypothetical protein F8M41_018143 [Gigaspora margarita]
MKTIRKSRKAVNHDYNQRKKDKYKALEEESKSLKELENTLRQYIARLEGQVELLKEELTNVKAENRRLYSINGQEQVGGNDPRVSTSQSSYPPTSIYYIEGQIYDFEAFGNGNPVGSVDDVILPTPV